MRHESSGMDPAHIKNAEIRSILLLLNSSLNFFWLIIPIPVGVKTISYNDTWWAHTII
eukprot:gene19934-7045_t